ncbi:hypothetical protein AVEN_30333-1 [Araneus ventricosus]|uniref:Uncharacterized protein n=1 Tax=Araneus ventricosus TaxID=182803 RepID=A0A4Y2MMB3_ARAVE|nr:hypothetical protein AVEN_30333-1 [Araneus ventricosus]
MTLVLPFCLSRFSQYIIDMYGFGMEWEICILPSDPSPSHLRKPAPDLQIIWWKSIFDYHSRTKIRLPGDFILCMFGVGLSRQVDQMTSEDVQSSCTSLQMGMVRSQ